MKNEMEDIKKQVAENASSKNTFRNFKKGQSSNTQPPNIISNAKSDQDTEEEQTEEEEDDEEEKVELNGMWDFILPNEEQHEALPMSTRSKNATEATQPNQQQNISTPVKDK